MNTKTRNPLAVLKDYSAQHGIPDDFDEAIAQVEALVDLARQCLPDLADSKLDGHLSRYDLLREALAAFTPNQDESRNSHEA
jgi:hypothetical protein